MDKAILSFEGVEGYDVYNTSIPFTHEGETYLFGRVEKRAEWAASHVRLFRQTDKDHYAAEPDSMTYPLEDPCIMRAGGEYVLCGTHVQKRMGSVRTYYAYFYRGTDPRNLQYFTTGPERMKDIRLVQLETGRIGVFSRPRGPEIEAKYGSGAIVGYAEVDSLDALNDEIIMNAIKIDGLFEKGEWGGSNQAYCLPDGTIGVIGHHSRAEVDAEGIRQKVYENIAFRFDPRRHALLSCDTIATREDFPPMPAKMPDLARCAFASGVVARTDGLVDLYSGLGDLCEGRIVVKNPFGSNWLTP